MDTNIQSLKMVVAEDTRTEAPREFLNCMLDYGVAALRAHLDKTGAPEAVKDLLEAVAILAIHLEDGGAVDATDSINEAVMTVARGVKATGSSFYTPDSEIKC